jgi:D-alanyl-lipoteichoic acid acyltransferase DltB (MBOAT superfamily)
MGICFYTFQTLSYTIDVYRKQREPEYHLGYFALYVTFFPQLVAGPIERSDRLIPQLRKEQVFNYARIVEGLQRMVWGFFKKVVIADNLAVAVNHVYGNVEEMSGLTLLIATGFFAYQIYCDFSGYSDIAIGSSKILGIDLMENFKRPYFSTSIKEFWSRWHISLSTWFRDYVYIPLGGSQKGSYRTYLNILIVFLISGLWHGASWMFVIWGAIHGLYQLYEKATYKFRARLWKSIHLNETLIQWVVKWIVTMSVVLVSWVLFRAQNLEDSLLILSKIVNIRFTMSFEYIYDSVRLTNIGYTNLIILFGSIILLEIVQSHQEFNYFDRIFEVIYRKKLLRYFAYNLMIIVIILFAYIGESEFIYFQF